MTDRREVVIVRWPGRSPSTAEGGLAELLAAYHLRTEAEKGEAVTDVDGLPERYEAEVLDPRVAFVDDAVLVAMSGDTAVGCLVVTAPVGRRSEIKRLWTDPAHRGQGIGSGLVSAALAHCADSGVRTVRLSVWEWRADAVTLYKRLGFTVTESWDERDQLVCMERTV
ncbi:GNAT family N-acetyltransferase [Microtetraspora sp. AC03309]|uniref:GNAT family N-acetyltransferase n=1 Tax=Microtetraspora sp. AC03309 TaxID=2779376 RepID=UPI001E2B220E|nr:GNAT family N-acetyltransferase [Microtetraspora sp. AC03309]MCC5577252.1 GNAT family N-acetyltransferase [Microtetraspora sp. AC03309]